MATYLKTPQIISNLKQRGIDIYNLTPEQYRKLSTISVLSPTVASQTQYHGGGQNYINLIDALQSGNAGKINFTDLEKMLDSRFGRLSNEPSKPKLGEENNPITLPEITVQPQAEVNWADINNNLLPQKTQSYDPQKWFYEGIEWMKNNPYRTGLEIASYIPGADVVADGLMAIDDYNNGDKIGAGVGVASILLPAFLDKPLKLVKKGWNKLMKRHDSVVYDWNKPELSGEKKEFIVGEGFTPKTIDDVYSENSKFIQELLQDSDRAKQINGYVYYKGAGPKDLYYPIEAVKYFVKNPQTGQLEPVFDYVNGINVPTLKHNENFILSPVFDQGMHKSGTRFSITPEGKMKFSTNGKFVDKVLFDKPGQTNSISIIHPDYTDIPKRNAIRMSKDMAFMKELPDRGFMYNTGEQTGRNFSPYSLEYTLKQLMQTIDKGYKVKITTAPVVTTTNNIGIRDKIMEMNLLDNLVRQNNIDPKLSELEKVKQLKKLEASGQLNGKLLDFQYLGLKTPEQLQQNLKQLFIQLNDKLGNQIDFDFENNLRYTSDSGNLFIPYIGYEVIQKRGGKLNKRFK